MLAPRQPIIWLKMPGLYDLGAFGIRVGLPGVYTDTDANVPHNTTVQNTLIASYGRVFPARLACCKATDTTTLTRRTIFMTGIIARLRCARWAVRGVAGSHGSFNNVTEFNHTYNVGQGMTDDIGCIYYNTGGRIITAPETKF